MDTAYIQISITKSICTFRNTVQLQAPSLETLSCNTLPCDFPTVHPYILRHVFSHQFMTPIMTTLFQCFWDFFFSTIVKLMMGYVPRIVLLLLTLSESSLNLYFLLLENFYTWGRFSKGPDFGPKKLLYGCLTHYLRNIISERKISFVISIY